LRTYDAIDLTSFPVFVTRLARWGSRNRNMAAPIEEVCLIDGEDNQEYIVILNIVDAEKAQTGTKIN